eukprot:3970803-Karenia_brevis.AAC.1
MEILWEIAAAEAEILSLPWYARVPSESNCSDGPSRGDYDIVSKLRGTIVSPRVPQEGLFGKMHG